VVAISAHQASTARGVGATAVIHHGIDLDPIPVGTGAGGYACFLGRMAPAKGAKSGAGRPGAGGPAVRACGTARQPGETQWPGA
jgi:hypothetical protein